jgi:hypothetical protein
MNPHWNFCDVVSDGMMVLDSDTYPDKEPVEEHIEGCADKKHDECRRELSLCLHESFACLKCSITRSTKYKDLKVSSCQVCCRLLWHDGANDSRSIYPYQSDGDRDHPQEVNHTLQLEADQSTVTRAYSEGKVSMSLRNRGVVMSKLCWASVLKSVEPLGRKCILRMDFRTK